jgi:phosphoserine phosphatase
MQHVVTLIANPRTPCLDQARLDSVIDTLAIAVNPLWLKPAIACEFSLAAGTAVLPELEQKCRAALGQAPVDVAVQPAGNRAKRLLLADMDSTMIEQECIDELGAHAGLRDEIAAITERAMRGELDFEAALTKRVGLLAGLNAEVIEDVLANNITLTPGGRTLIATMRAHGAYCALISGGFTAFTSPIGERIGFDHARANRLEIEAGVLTGRISQPILGREAKLATLLELCEARGHTTDEALAVGDGANDLAMVEAAGMGVAFHAKPAVAQAARFRIEHGDLTALLYLQGYRADEFVTA